MKDFCGTILFNQNLVLNPDTKLTGKVNARLAGKCHTRTDNRGLSCSC